MIRDNIGGILTVGFWIIVISIMMATCDGKSSGKNYYNDDDMRGRSADYDRSHYRSRGRRR